MAGVAPDNFGSAEPPLVRYGVDHDTGIASIVLDSPANRNALSHTLVIELLSVLETSVADPGVRAAVLTAGGPAFCAGVDLNATRAEREDLRERRALPRLFRLMLESDLPLVALIDGAVRGGGLGLVAASDIAVGSSAADFALPEVLLGVVPAVVSVPLSHRLDQRALRRYSLTGQIFDGAAAVKAGLLTAVTDDLDRAESELRGQLATADPAALRRTKRLLAEIGRADLDHALEVALHVSVAFHSATLGTETTT